MLGPKKELREMFMKHAESGSIEAPPEGRPCISDLHEVTNDKILVLSGSAWSSRYLC